jgi:transposase-like protein
MNETETKSERQPNTSQERRRQWIEQLQKSGLTQVEFARQNGLKLSTLHNWIYKRPEKSFKCKTPPGWKEVRMPVLSSSIAWVAEVSLPNGVTVRLGSQPAEFLLAQILGKEPCLR